MVGWTLLGWPFSVSCRNRKKEREKVAEGNGGCTTGRQLNRSQWLKCRSRLPKCRLGGKSAIGVVINLNVVMVVEEENSG